MSKVLIFLAVGLLLVGCVSAMTIDYYFHPNCAYCQTIAPFMSQTINRYIDVNWNVIDTSIGSYNIPGTPFLVLRTSDERTIEMSGSYDIPKYLWCEINQQSNLNCVTYAASECVEGSWFIRE